MGKGQGKGGGKGAMNTSAPPPYGGQTYGQQQQQQQQIGVVYQTTTTNAVVVGNQDGIQNEMVAVPVMPKPLAVVCCILNFLIPGLGTIVAGFSSFCCARSPSIDASGPCFGCCIGCAVGFFQMASTFFFFVGWIWSCVWGVCFIVTSVKSYNSSRVTPDQGYINRPVQNGAVISTVVTTQPSQGASTYNQQPSAPPPYDPSAVGLRTSDPAYPPPPPRGIYD